MINIIHIDIHLDDKRHIAAIEMKLKSFKTEERKALTGHPLIATASAAFFQTTLLTDEGKTLNIMPNPKRNNVVDIKVFFKENQMTLEDVANFVKAFQRTLDETSLF